MDYFTSDFHLGEINTSMYRGFDNSAQMDEKLYKSLEVLKPRDRFFFLGDIGREGKELVEYVTRVKKASFYWIEGNHDKDIIKKIEGKNLYKYQTFLVKKNSLFEHDIFLSHFPHLIFNKSHYGAFQLHGHGHQDTSDRPILEKFVFGKRLNVNIELNDYKLWNRNEIEEYMNKMPLNIDCVSLLSQNNKEANKILEDYLNSIEYLTQKMYKEINECLK